MNYGSLLLFLWFFESQNSFSYTSTTVTYSPLTSGSAPTTDYSSSNSSSTNSYQWSGLNCSAYGVSSTNVSLQQMSWPARLRACFNANPYDTTQLPLPPGSASSIKISYDYSVIYIIQFEGNLIKLVGQLAMTWVDYYRLWDVNNLPVYTMHIPLGEIWYPQVQFLSTMTKRSIALVDPEDLALLVYLGTIQTQEVVYIKKHVVEGHCEVHYYSNKVIHCLKF